MFCFKLIEFIINRLRQLNLYQLLLNIIIRVKELTIHIYHIKYIFQTIHTFLYINSYLLLFMIIFQSYFMKIAFIYVNLSIKL